MGRPAVRSGSAATVRCRGSGFPRGARATSLGVDGATRLEIGADDGNLTLAALDDFRGVFLDGGDADALEVREDRLAFQRGRRSSAVFASSSVLWPAMDAGRWGAPGGRCA